MAGDALKVLRDSLSGARYAEGIEALARLERLVEAQRLLREHKSIRPRYYNQWLDKKAELEDLVSEDLAAVLGEEGK